MSRAAAMDRWRAALAAGEERVGWKIGINDPRVQESLGLEAPVVGHLTSASVLPGGGECAVGGMTIAIAEPEVAIELGADVPGDASLEDARAAIGALAPALEIVDVDAPLDDLEAILAGNVFHRAVAFGPFTAGASLDGAAGRFVVAGEERAAVSPAAALADPGETVAHVARVLAGAGEGLEAGDRIIAGSMAPPAQVNPGDEAVLELGPLGSVSLRFT